MDEHNCDHDDPSLGQMVGQAFLVSAASVVGMFAGMILVGKTYEWMDERKKRKAETTEEK